MTRVRGILMRKYALRRGQQPKPKQLTRRRRKETGIWLRQLREERRLSQRELASAVGVEVYTVIAQLEDGRGLIPRDRYQQWADALGVEPHEFVRRLMEFWAESERVRLSRFCRRRLPFSSSWIGHSLN